jgi:GntR family transcriptional regulator
MTATLERPGVQARQVQARQIQVCVDRQSPVPLYYQLAEQLARAIRDGILKPGDPFENEVALAERLGMSRPTVRRSIAELVSQGLLVRRRGVGTAVAHAAVHRRGELTSLHDDLRTAGRVPGTRVLRLEYGATDRRAAGVLELDARTPLVYLERLRLVDGKPFALLRNWLPPAAGDLSARDLESRGLYDLLRDRGIVPAVAHQSVGSRPAVPDEQVLLGLGRAASVLTMTRRAYNSAGHPVEFGDHSYRPDGYQIDVTVYAR